MNSNLWLKSFFSSKYSIPNLFMSQFFNLFKEFNTIQSITVFGSYVLYTILKYKFSVCYVVTNETNYVISRFHMFTSILPKIVIKALRMKYPLHSILDLQNTYIRNKFSSTKFLKLRVKNLPLTYTETLKLNVRSSSSTPCTSLVDSFTKQNYYLNLTTLWEVNFLRKEKIYTKLKYSRCPQYDIISGGFAAIFAGFIGFLISEKFGIELVDSGDFYIALMYGIFSIFSIRPLLRIYSITSTPYAPYSLKYSVLFWLDFCNLVLNWFKRFF